MKNYRQEGHVLTLVAMALVLAGQGCLFGQALFGVAINTTEAGQTGEFVTEGVIAIDKTNAVAIAVGDRLFWDPVAQEVNTTNTNQQCVGLAVEAAPSGTATVAMLLVASTATGA